jgi:hypothetical protein
VEGLDLEDQVLSALAQANAGKRPDEYEPSRSSKQFRLLMKLTGAETVEPERALAGLANAAAETPITKIAATATRFTRLSLTAYAARGTACA